MNGPLWATIFSHNLNYFTYSLVCKGWRDILVKYPEIVWTKKVQEVLRRYDCPKHLVDAFFVPSLLVKITSLESVVGWIYKKDLTVHKSNKYHFLVSTRISNGYYR